MADLCRDLLEKLPEVDGESREASPAALTETTREQTDAATEASTPEPVYPLLTPALVAAWSATSLESHTGRPEVGPWLRGWVEEEIQTTVVFRNDLPPAAMPQKDRAAFFDAARPQMVERLELPRQRVLDWLGKRVGRVAKNAELSKELASTPVLEVLDGSGTPAQSWTLDTLKSEIDAGRRSALPRLLAGATAVVHTGLGGLDATGLLDERWDDRALDVLAAGLAPEQLPLRVGRIPDPEKELEAGWSRLVQLPSKMVADEVTEWLVVEKFRDATPNEDARSTAKRKQKLDEHQDWAHDEAHRITSSLGLPLQIASLVETAAALHDEGKRASRWQRAFRAPKDAAYAKTVGPVNIHLLGGYRHELGSLPYAQRSEALKNLSPDDRDLVLHLIAAHHGFARPLIRGDGCEDAPPSVVEERVRAVALRFYAQQERWGPWGLAYLEMLVRAADQRASARLEE
ncbi:MAG: hypothetical protein R3F61_35615 [Myxococcota bacterium]